MGKIEEYIESGILEAYVLGSASEAEARELLFMKDRYPEVLEALHSLETDLEMIAQQMAITPPPGTWKKIEQNMQELVKSPRAEGLTLDIPASDNHNYSRSSAKSSRDNQFLEVEAESGHIRIRKIWRWIFAAVFLLGKIFLAFAIYFYIENKHNEKELERLRLELKLQNQR